MGARYSIIGATAEQVRGAGGTDIKETRMGIIFATLTLQQAEALRRMGFTVSEVSQVKTAVMPPTPVAGAPTYSPEQLVWVAGLENLRAAIRPPPYGEGLNLALIDSGIRETHERVRGRVVYGKNYTTDPMRDGFGHGTGVASIAVAAAPLCGILNLKVLDPAMGSGHFLVESTDYLARALVEALGADPIEIDVPAAANFQRFTSSNNWTKPAGVTHVIIDCIGAGGGGGGGGGMSSIS